MAKPIAIITADVGHTALPVTSAPVTVTLDASTSTHVGAMTYQWYLDKPPESAAVLSSATAAAPTYVMDVPGIYQARLQVTDTVDTSEGFEVRIDPATSPYKFKAPASAYYITRMSQALTETVPPTSGARDVSADERELFFVVEGLQSIVSATTGLAPYTRYVTSIAGPAAADGSVALPFNATSASANSYDGPVQQAVAALAALGVADPGAPRTIVLAGGGYSEAVTIDAYTPWKLVPQGYVVFDPAHPMTYVAKAAAAADPNFLAGDPGGLLWLPPLVLTGAYASGWYLFWDRTVVYGAITESGAFANPAGAIFRHVTTIGACNTPDVQFYDVSESNFGGLVTASGAEKIEHSIFDGGLTLTTAASQPGRGFRDCFISGTFTGPAGTALFDQPTCEAFYAAGGTFSGGAGSNDYMPSMWALRQYGLPLTVTDTGVATTPFVSSHYMDFGVTENDNFRISAWISLYLLDATQSCKLELTVEPIGGTPVVIATQALDIVGPFSGSVRLDSDVMATNVDATGSLTWHYVAKGGGVGTPLTVDDEDIGLATGTVDMSPPTLRPNAQVVATAGFTSGKSFAYLRRLRIDYTGA